ncbi:hypothetical protein [Parasitella parasitica]|uniref:Uncharacterized protein n=1 Tax=Parasitella parasitica TaxID=35722 RepID=A0A0B7NCM5_9FUNG|nr:hypothetical protein [Parasitella parasitica]
MSAYENKGSSRKGNNTKKGQAHQNTSTWKHNKNSKKSRTIAALPVYGLCQRCTEVILWRKQYKKYKPLTTAKRCTCCQEKAIKEAYHILCDNCARSQGVCAKCKEAKEILVSKDEVKTNADEMREGQEMERMLSRMTLRQRKSYMRKMERGDDVSGIVNKNEDSDFDFEDSDLNEEDSGEDSEEDSDEDSEQNEEGKEEKS